MPCWIPEAVVGQFLLDLVRELSKEELTIGLSFVKATGLTAFAIGIGIALRIARGNIDIRSNFAKVVSYIQSLLKRKKKP
jgi:hypothetical protein